MHPVIWLAASPRGRRVAAALIAATAVLVVVIAVTASSLLPRAAALPMSGLPCPVEDVAVSDGDGETGLDADQIEMAQVIIGVGQAERVPTRGQVVAITAALQESGLRNLDHGDRDSLGLFQMRPSMGWGTREEILNPYYAAKKFYDVLRGVKGWQQMTVNDAAQAVERSGFPHAYAKHVSRAVQIVASIGPSTGNGGATQVDTAGCSPAADTPTGATGDALSIMLQQVGKPYVWGGTGPNGFDCSGLIVYGWRTAGYQLSVRTSQQMHTIATPVKSGQEQSGDLIFSGFEGGSPTHVMVVVKPGLLVEAPRTGLDVRVREYDTQSENLKFGRLPKSSLTPLDGA